MDSTLAYDVSPQKIQKKTSKPEDVQDKALLTKDAICLSVNLSCQLLSCILTNHGSVSRCLQDTSQTIAGVIVLYLSWLGISYSNKSYRFWRETLVMLLYLILSIKNSMDVSRYPEDAWVNTLLRCSIPTIFSAMGHSAHSTCLILGLASQVLAFYFVLLVQNSTKEAMASIPVLIAASLAGSLLSRKLQVTSFQHENGDLSKASPFYMELGTTEDVSEDLVGDITTAGSFESGRKKWICSRQDKLVESTHRQHIRLSGKEKFIGHFNSMKADHSLEPFWERFEVMKELHCEEMNTPDLQMDLEKKVEGEEGNSGKQTKLEPKIRNQLAESAISLSSAMNLSKVETVKVAIGIELLKLADSAMMHESSSAEVWIQKASNVMVGLPQENGKIPWCHFSKTTRKVVKWKKGVRFASSFQAPRLMNLKMLRKQREVERDIQFELVAARIRLPFKTLAHAEEQMILSGYEKEFNRNLGRNLLENAYLCKMKNCISNEDLNGAIELLKEARLESLALQVASSKLEPWETLTRRSCLGLFGLFHPKVDNRAPMSDITVRDVQFRWISSCLRLENLVRANLKKISPELRPKEENILLWVAREVDTLEKLVEEDIRLVCDDVNIWLTKIHSSSESVQGSSAHEDNVIVGSLAARFHSHMLNAMCRHLHLFEFCRMILRPQQMATLLVALNTQLSKIRDSTSLLFIYDRLDTRQ